jgi:uncharacterized protein with FMN-binding domain
MKKKNGPAFGRAGLAVVAVVVAVGLGVAMADELELLNGNKLSGEIIEKTEEEMVFRAVMESATAEMRVPLAGIHAVTDDGERTVLNPYPEGEAPVRPSHPNDTRTPLEVKTLIAQIGEEKPEWWDSTPLNYPDTLDLSWRQVRKGWAPQYNLGAYMYTNIVEHPERWKEGIRLLHHALEVNRKNNDRRALDTTLKNLADRYRNLLQDYARSAYWNQRAGICDAAGLAECYWKLGSTTLAISLLETVGADRSRTGKVIKLWGEMGELGEALALADDAVRASRFPDAAYLAAADACRCNGRYDWARQCYEKVANATRGGRDLKASKARAQDSLQCLRGAENVDLSRIPDGTYPGRAEAGFKGPLEVEVTVTGGRIESVRVTRHQENWYLASIDYVPKKIVEEQGIVGVDAVTGATTTSRAIINATAAALVSAGSSQ